MPAISTPNTVADKIRGFLAVPGRIEACAWRRSHPIMASQERHPECGWDRYTSNAALRTLTQGEANPR